MEKEYCLQCQNENSPDRDVCECGGRNFVWGDDIKLIDGNVICKCGNNKFKMGIHIDSEHYANSSYTCSECGNLVGKQIYREMF